MSISKFHRNESPKPIDFSKPPVVTGELKIDAPVAGETVATPPVSELPDDELAAEKFVNPTAFIKGGSIAIHGAERASGDTHEVYDAPVASVEGHPSSQAAAKSESDVA